MINLHERMLTTRWGSNPQPPDHHSDRHPTVPLRLQKYGHQHTVETICMKCRILFSAGLGKRVIMFKYLFVFQRTSGLIFHINNLQDRWLTTYQAFSPLKKKSRLSSTTILNGALFETLHPLSQQSKEKYKMSLIVTKTLTLLKTKTGNHYFYKPFMKQCTDLTLRSRAQLFKANDIVS